MPLASFNPVPFRVGGGPTPTQRAYATLRNAVGEGGSAPNDRGVEGLWRRSEAKGLAASASHCRRALLQSSPLYATDLLPYYERILGIVPDADSTEAQRRDVVVPLWTKRANNATPVALEQLQRIDPRLSILALTHSGAAVTQYGRAFGPLSPELELPAFGLTSGHVRYPNYSTDLVVRVLFATGHAGPLTNAEATIVQRVRVLLRDLLPSTVDFTIVTDDGLWHVGVTPIGLGGVS
jgi:hypothetical protein